MVEITNLICIYWIIRLIPRSLSIEVTCESVSIPQVRICVSGVVETKDLQ